MTAGRAATEANHLYWESDASVAEIAARFDLSRRALYESVKPLASGSHCERCGGDLNYENRLARRTGQTVCADCGAQRTLTSDAHASDASSPVAVTGGVGRGDSRTSSATDNVRYAEARDGELRQRAVLLGGAAIAGMAIGTVAALLARRRD